MGFVDISPGYFDGFVYFGLVERFEQFDIEDVPHIDFVD